MSTEACVKKRIKLPIDGILILDKPQGLTSNAALQRVKRLFCAKKAGHTGSLDPLATGVLPLCFGEATKFSQYLLDSDKEYVVTAKLGIQTDTGDAEGEVIASADVPPMDTVDIETALARFRGTIEQVPPMYSALKFQGQPLYKLARQGVVIERATRCVEIFELVLLSFISPFLELRVRCSKGTYIRTLVEDVGEALGCGGHVVALRRTQAGPYTLSHAMSLPQLEDMALQNTEDPHVLQRCFLAPETAVVEWPELQLLDTTAYYFCHGQAVSVPQAPTAGWVRVTQASNGCFLGLGEMLDDGRVTPRRLIVRPGVGRSAG